VYDAKRALLAVRFFERVLKHTADQYYGQPFLLAPWQREVLEQVFGHVDDDGNRIIDTVYLEVVKKTGKTELAAGLSLLLLFLADQMGMRGSQIYGAASTAKQAGNVYRAACAMIEQSGDLQSRFRVLRSTNRIISRTDPDTYYQAIAGDGDASDGINPLCAIIDEVHRWKTRKQLENWDVLTKGGVTRRQTLTIAITTAGVRDESPLAWRLHEKTRKIRDGIAADPRFFGRIYAADHSDDPGDPKTWIKANPSLKENGGFLELAKIRAEYDKAASEGDLTSFKRYFLNIWDQKSDRAIDMTKYDASAGPWISRGLAPQQPEDVVRPLHRDLTERFIERRAWAGGDLSMTTDLSSLVFVFRDEEADAFEFLPFFWMPSSDIRKREVRDGVPYRKWAEDGFLELCEGEVIDYRLIKARIEWGARMFDLQEIAFDPWNSRQLTAPLIEEGYRCQEIRQGYQSLSEASKKVLELIAQGKFWHGGHPVLRWNASCVSTTTDGRDNIMFTKPNRKKDSARIDGIAAAVNGLARAIVDVEAGAAVQAFYRSGLTVL
jgi:phage terminase large subunit-like protein